MSRLLAVDVGLRRVGVAVSDPSRTIATPLTTLRNDGEASVAVAVASLCHQHGADAVVVGLPRAASGADTAVTRRARALGPQLERKRLAVHWVDEELTSREAEEVLDAHGASAADKHRVRRTGGVDRVAAAIILRRYLQRERAEERDPPG